MAFDPEAAPAAPDDVKQLTVTIEVYPAFGGQPEQRGGSIQVTLRDTSGSVVRTRSVDLAKATTAAERQQLNTFLTTLLGRARSEMLGK